MLDRATLDAIDLDYVEIAPKVTGVALVGADASVEYCNDRAQDLVLGTGWRNRDIIDLLRDSEKHGMLATGSAARMANSLAGGATSVQLGTPDGRTILVSSTALGQARRMYEFVDVTEVLNRAERTRKDPLTGLPNRLDLVHRLDQALTDDDDQTAAVLFIDLDRFKAVNDTLGHPIGDALLRRVAERLSKTIGPDDILARLGGDEFVVVQRGSEQPGGAERLATEIIDVLGRAYLVQGHMVNVASSVGIALSQTDGTTPEALISNADLALYSAKDGGKGTFRFFTSELEQRMQERRSLEMDLRRALALQEFSLAFQPQFEIGARKLVGFECLLRWKHEVRGNVSPADFIPLAEETGLIVQIGEWVLRSACHEAASWGLPISIAVNISPVQFGHPGFLQTVVSALASSGLPGSCLELEITEGVLLEDTDAVIATLQKLRSLGIRVSMDDFGTGYSSLSYLQKFPFDKVKIDQSFVRSMVSSSDSSAIVRAISALSASLGMTTVAEGVETEEQLIKAAQEGCMHVQGFLTGRPLDARAAREVISSQIVEHS